MITVGLDFGTHQTKVCIEEKDGVELKYSFLKHKDQSGAVQYTLPSIIGIDVNKHLQYGYLERGYDGEIIRYFKQAAFRKTGNVKMMSQENALYFSIWYIAYILFDLEEKYGDQFAIQMGAPTDSTSTHVENAKQIATRIVCSAYRLVEDVFNNDKQSFLACDLTQLITKTEILDYSQTLKDEYALLVFPEAYACLKPLVSQRKIATGMSLMIDIGGGTTDISFFTIESGAPQVYDFYSIPKGLNYLTCAELKEFPRSDSNILSASEISASRKLDFESEIRRICANIKEKLNVEFNRQTEFDSEKLFAALKKRPIIYTGGGSTFSVLRQPYAGYIGIKQVSEKEWNAKAIQGMNDISFRSLCPILSTAYGLAISTEHDNIRMKPFRDIFEITRAWKIDKPTQKTKSFGSDFGGFDYANDWDAWK